MTDAKAATSWSGQIRGTSEWSVCRMITKTILNITMRSG